MFSIAHERRVCQAFIDAVSDGGELTLGLQVVDQAHVVGLREIRLAEPQQDSIPSFLNRVVVGGGERLRPLDPPEPLFPPALPILSPAGQQGAAEGDDGSRQAGSDDGPPGRSVHGIATSFGSLTACWGR